MSSFYINLYTDGASKGNPGPAGAGFIIKDEKGEVLKKGYKFLGIKTNNEAEYLALLFGLKEAQRLRYKNIKIYLDSELLVKQLSGQYRVKSLHLKPLFESVRKELKKFESYDIFYIRRELNFEADILANKAIR